MRNRLLVTLVLITPALAPALAAQDTLHLRVGSPEVNARLYRPHAARVRVRVGPDTGRLVAEWTNELALGDSAGRPVMRWVTKGTQYPASGAPVTSEIRQTYDGRTLAPLGYALTASTGAAMRLTIDGSRVTGTRRGGGQGTDQQVNVVVEQPGFMASASDLVPVAVGLRAGAVMTAPLWGPNMTASEQRVFTVLERVPLTVEGTAVVAWKVEERRRADRTLLATWYLTEESPYMVYGEVVLPNGQIQRMTEVPIQLGGR